MGGLTSGGGRRQRPVFAVNSGGVSSGYQGGGGVRSVRRSAARLGAARGGAHEHARRGGSAILWGSAGPRRWPWPSRGRPLAGGRMGPAGPGLGRHGQAGQVRVEPTDSAQVDRKCFFTKYFS
jgi:hypothetical protein